MIFFYTLLIYGHTNIITQSEIFEPIRDWADKTSHFLSSLFSCPMCMGFWVGVFWSFIAIFWPQLTLSPTLSFLSNENVPYWIRFLCDGIIGSAISWIVHNFISALMSYKDSQKERVLRMIEEIENDPNFLND